MTKSPTIDVSFWFAVFSPLVGILTGFPRARPILPMNTIRETELLPRLKQPARTAGMPADKWNKIFRRRRMNDPLLIFNMAIFNVDDGWRRIFNPLKIHQNGT